MASGHVNRIERPNTWLHRPPLQRASILDNLGPSTHGPLCRFLAARHVGSKWGVSGPIADIANSTLIDPLPTFGVAINSRAANDHVGPNSNIGRCKSAGVGNGV